MKIVFCGSITGGMDDREIYFQLVDELEKYGEVSSDHKRSFDVTVKDGNMPADIHSRDVNYVLQSDVVIAEVTKTSMGVGYELGRAVAAGKKILCLYRTDFEKISPMITGCPQIKCKKYGNLQEAAIILKQYFNEIK